MFLTREQMTAPFCGKSIAIVGSGPSCRSNTPGFIDSHDIVVRINNFKLFPETGSRTDVFYSFFGGSIIKQPHDLIGVKLCLCKCPDAKIIDSAWHTKNRKTNGVDFRYIYRKRRRWWPCDVYIPSKDEFMTVFRSLGDRIPTTGFSCIRTLAELDCEIYITGFDFFTSEIHNVDEQWCPGNEEDPIRRAPERELAWIKKHKDRFSFDETLQCLITEAATIPTISSMETHVSTSSP